MNEPLPATKHCGKCNRDLPTTEFHKNKRMKDGLQMWCKPCYLDYFRESEKRRAYMRERAKEFREAHPDVVAQRTREYYANHKDERGEYNVEYHRTHLEESRARKHEAVGTPAYTAQMRLQTAVRSGKIEKPSACQRCGTNTEPRFLAAHHDDYDKPYDVLWLCPACHRTEHRKYKD